MSRSTKVFCLLIGMFLGMGFWAACSSQGHAQEQTPNACECARLAIPDGGLKSPLMPGTKVIRVEQRDMGQGSPPGKAWTQTATVKCPARSVMYSGGCYAKTADPANIVQTLTRPEIDPIDEIPNGYTCGRRNIQDSSFPEYVVAYAVCVTVIIPE